MSGYWLTPRMGKAMAPISMMRMEMTTENTGRSIMKWENFMPRGSMRLGESRRSRRWREIGRGRRGARIRRHDLSLFRRHYRARARTLDPLDDQVVRGRDA